MEAKESKDLVLAVAVFDREYLQRKRIVYLLWQTFYKRGKRGNGALWYDVVSTFFVLNFSIIRYVLTRGEGVNKSAVPWELQRKPKSGWHRLRLDSRSFAEVKVKGTVDDTTPICRRQQLGAILSSIQELTLARFRDLEDTLASRVAWVSRLRLHYFTRSSSYLPN